MRGCEERRTCSTVAKYRFVKKRMCSKLLYCCAFRGEAWRESSNSLLSIVISSYAISFSPDEQNPMHGCLYKVSSTCRRFSNPLMGNKKLLHSQNLRHKDLSRATHGCLFLDTCFQLHHSRHIYTCVVVPFHRIGLTYLLLSDAHTFGRNFRFGEWTLYFEY